MITQEDIDLALTICQGDRNAYRLASWLSGYTGHCAPGMMAEIRAYLGMSNEVDAEVAVGISSMIEPGPRRNPRLPTRKE